MSDRPVKRVLMTGDTVGGVWSFTLDLAQSLGARGVSVMLASMGGNPSDAQRAEAAAIPNLQLLTSAYKLEWMSDPWQDVEASGRWLLDVARDFEPDVIHLNTYGHGSLRFQAPVVMTAHSCVLSWWAAVKQEPLPTRWNRYREEVATSIKAADYITAPSRAMLRSIEENYGADLPATRVVPNGRSSARFRPLEKEPIVLSAGRLWDDAKNVGTLARVAPSIEWPVYVAGENRHADGSEPELGECHLLGHLSGDELAQWYGRAAIYALPARYEPFGLSILEAALSGCALVLGDIASLREVWGDTALFVPPNDTAALEAALRQLITRPELREQMSRRSMALALAYTPERTAQAYADIYGVLAGQWRTACAS